MESERLKSWAEIAEFLEVSVRTAQLWEKAKRLPVHRFHPHGKGTVFAYKSELENWITKVDTEAPPDEPAGRWNLVWSLLALATLVGLMVAFWVFHQ